MTETLIIKEPVWHNRSVGIHPKYENVDLLIIVIDFRNSEGKRVFPDDYCITGSKLKTYPKKTNQKKLTLIEVPIKDLKIMNKPLTESKSLF